MPAARDIDIFPTTVCTARFYLKIASRCRSENRHYLRVGERELLYPAQPLKEEERGAPLTKGQKESSFFRESYPRGKNHPFHLRESLDLQTSLRRTAGARLNIDRVSNSRVTASPMADEADLFVGSTRSFPGKFSPSLPSLLPLPFAPGSTEHRRSRLTCCRITGSTLAACPLASYLSSSPYLALPRSLFSPGRPGEIA